ncbi:unnamed protein product [Arctogadus glacialis]
MPFRSDYLDKHAATQHHQNSVKAHAALIQGSPVLVAFDPVIILEHEAVIGGFKYLYHLTIKEQAHHTNYADLLELAELLGCQYFEKLKSQSSNLSVPLWQLGWRWTRPRMFLLRSSLMFTLDTWDKEGLLYSQFLDLVTVSDGRADTIVKAIREVHTKKHIPAWGQMEQLS